MANILMKYDQIMSERKSGVINFSKNVRGRNGMNIGEISGNGNVINNNYVNVYQQNTFKDQIMYILEHMKTKIVKPIEDILNDVVSIITIRTTASTTSLLLTPTTTSTTTSSTLTTSTTSTSTTTSTKTTSSTTSTTTTTITSTTR